ncbi:CHY zinc finger protein [Virgibacillus halodenitrificans]|uniref:CHY zinc finger protein n=1 Tax=Virgibacillus halodenitrificans TaxID=1482 RepID=UPI0024BFCC51|nr:CHY zinc finger protein [Virgibacillus halodenitrificans]WHX26674.1 CHY zinc finger protein [Virgibacillus halodenitrificans]
MKTHGIQVKGAIDAETRCKHYNSEADRIAIKFFCCNNYYPCYQCHKEYGCGQTAVWPREKFDEKAILCGNCGAELTINNYFNAESACPLCKASFNPGCKLHKHLYFSS